MGFFSYMDLFSGGIPVGNRRLVFASLFVSWQKYEHVASRRMAGGMLAVQLSAATE